MQGNVVNSETSRETLLQPITHRGIGELVSLNETNVYPFKRFDIYGNSWQETDNTKPSPDNPSRIRNVGDNINLISKIEDGYYDRVSKTITKEQPYVSFTISDINAGTYTLSSNSVFHVIRGLTDYDNSTNVIFSNKIVESIEVYTFEVIEKTTLYMSVRRADGANWTNEDLLKLEERTEATPYSPFGCGNVNFNINNKNLCNLNKASLILSSDTIRIINSATSITGTPNTEQPYNYSRYVLNLNVRNFLGRTLYIKYNCSRDNADMGLELRDKDGQEIIGRNNSITIPQDTSLDSQICLMIYWALGMNMHNNPVTFSDIMISTFEGDNFIPNQEQIISFPLEEGQVFHKGDYLADDGIHHVRKTIELDGTGNWGKYNNLLYLYIEDCALSKESNYDIPDLLCTHFKAVPFVNLSQNANNGIANNVVGNPNQHKGVCLYVHDSITDVNTLKSWLAEQKEKRKPIILEYPLAEEIIEPYSAEQRKVWNEIKRLKSYNDTTNILSDDEVSPIFDVESFIDINDTSDETQSSLYRSIIDLTERINNLDGGKSDKPINYIDRVRINPSFEFNFDLRQLSLKDGLVVINITLVALEQVAIKGAVITEIPDELIPIVNNEGRHPVLQCYSWEKGFLEAYLNTKSKSIALKDTRCDIR